MGKNRFYIYSLTRRFDEFFLLIFRHSMMIPPSTETAKYNRQQDLKEIHDNFMKTYKQTDNKIKGVETEERKSKAYKMITSNAQPSYLDDREAKRQCVR